MSLFRKLRNVMASGLAVGMVMAFAGQTAMASVCGGQDLIGKLRSENPELYQKVADEAAKTSNGEAVLWKIDGNGAAAPSYLLGTVQVTDDRLATLSDPVKKVLDTVKVLALEVPDFGDMQRLQKTFNKRPDLIVLKGGSLWRYMEPGMQEAVARQLEQVGVPQNVARLLQPWLAAAKLSISLCESKRRYAGHPIHDLMLATYAKERGAEVVGLETAIEQFTVISSMSIGKQAVFLIDVERLYDQMHDVNETLLQAYMDRKVTWYIPLVKTMIAQDRTAAGEEIDADYLTVLIGKRAINMAERVEAIAKSGNALIAVGTLLLPGDQGLVTLLRKRGFTVTAVD